MITPFIYPSVIIAFVVLILIYIMLKYTKFGRAIYAVGSEQSGIIDGIECANHQDENLYFQRLSCFTGRHSVLFEYVRGFVEQARGFEMEAIAFP